jgi:hypothetical protein
MLTVLTVRVQTSTSGWQLNLSKASPRPCFTTAHFAALPLCCLACSLSSLSLSPASPDDVVVDPPALGGTSPDRTDGATGTVEIELLLSARVGILPLGRGSPVWLPSLLDATGRLPTPPVAEVEVFLSSSMGQTVEVDEEDEEVVPSDLLEDERLTVDAGVESALDLIDVVASTVLLLGEAIGPNDAFPIDLCVVEEAAEEPTVGRGTRFVADDPSPPNVLVLVVVGITRSDATGRGSPPGRAVKLGGGIAAIALVRPTGTGGLELLLLGKSALRLVGADAALEADGRVGTTEGRLESLEVIGRFGGGAIREDAGRTEAAGASEVVEPSLVRGPMATDGAILGRARETALELGPNDQPDVAVGGTIDCLVAVAIPVPVPVDGKPEDVDFDLTCPA